MNIVADESVEVEIINSLRDTKHSVFAIAELCPGIPDEDLLFKSRNRVAILLTPDKDFGTLIFQKKENSAGVVLYRLGSLSNQEKARIVSDVFKLYGNQLQNRFSVINEREIRIRSMGTGEGGENSGS